MKQKLIALGSAACLLAGLGAYADEKSAVSQSFEDGVNDALVSTLDSGNVKWTGYGYITNYNDDVYATTPASGLPIRNAAHQKTVLVEGQMACTTGVSSVSGGTSTDFMVKLTAPDEPLADLTDGTIQVALATATNGVDATKVDLKLWCIPTHATSASWVTLLTNLTADAWARVTLNFSYTSGKECCQVLVDGDAVCTLSGYLANDMASEVGSWYKLAHAPSSSTINSIEVKGMTELDDLVVKTGVDYSNYKPYVDASGNAITSNVKVVNTWTAIPVDKNDMLKWGVNEDTIKVRVGVDATNPKMTVMQELAAGITPGSEVAYKVTKVEIKEIDSVVKAQLTVPALTPPDGYKNQIAITSSDGTSVDSVDIASGATTVNVSLPSASSTDAKKYTYQLKTVTK